MVTFGLWSHSKTTLSQLAAKMKQFGDHQSVSAEAIHQRMNRRAVDFLKEFIQQALGKMQALDYQYDDGVFDFFHQVYLADSTGFGLPESLRKLFPGSGGSGSPAGAKIQLVWEYKRSGFAHFALTPWNLPDQKYVNQVVKLAQKAISFGTRFALYKLRARFKVMIRN